MIKVGIIVGSTRPGRKAAAVAKWVQDLLKNRNDAEFEIVDIEDYKLPLDEPMPPIMHQYSKPHTKAWSEKMPHSTPTFSLPRNTTMRLQQR
jgi:NAD(P)H-dependent FMN reductase